MAEKHKSKYKAPKDLEKSQKPKPRKDLKDYTVEDKDEKMNPNSTGEKQKNVLRKTDKEVIDNGSLIPDIKDGDRMYDVTGEKHDPKKAAKVMSKRQDDDEKENKENIKDKIENLTREQKERLVREMIRRRIKNVLKEQEETPEEVPVEEPVAEPAPTATPAEAPAAEPAPAEAPAEAPTPTTGNEPAQDSSKGAEGVYLDHLRSTSPSAMDLVKNIMKLGVRVAADYEYEDKKNFYKLLKLSADKLFSKSASITKE